MASPGAYPPETSHHIDLFLRGAPPRDCVCEFLGLRMINSRNFRHDWLTNVPTELLSGTLVALALIPEAIGFSIVAGVDPKVGLYASFSIAVVTVILGGRRAMISAATASTAVLMITLVRDHGLQYLFAATILMGLLQIIAGAARVGLVMNSFPAPS